MERRIQRRFPRRVEVRFWRQGDAQGHAAFTTNISRTGLFLGSASSLVPGERLRLEIVDPERGFMIEGRVARVHRVSLALRHVAQPGVGVRFLLPEELVEELLPPVARQAGPARMVEIGAADPAEVEVLQNEAPAERSWNPPRSNSAVANSEPMRRIVVVAFDDASTFLSVYHRDIASGGLFVSTPEPAELNESVWIELKLPLDDVRPSMIAARVVQRFDPKAAVGAGRNLLAGMAVQFLEPEKVLADLKPLLVRLRG